MHDIVIIGCGYIGTNLANYFAINSNRNITLYGTDNSYSRMLNPRINFVLKRMEEINDTDIDVFQDSIIIDATGNTTPINELKDSSILFIDNCLSKIHFIKQLEKMHINKYIFLSSGGTVYTDSINPHKETELLDPKSLYGLEKAIIEKYLTIYGLEENKFNYEILRISNPYGGFISQNKKQGIIDVALLKLFNNETFNLYGDYDNIRDYIYINDLCKIVLKLIDTDINNEIINIGSGEGHTIREIIELIEKYTNKKLTINHIESKTKNIKANILDMDKLKSIVGDIDYCSLEEGIQLCLKRFNK